MTENELTEGIIGSAIEVHREIGPGLLESIYEECLAMELSLRGIHFERQFLFQSNTRNGGCGWISGSIFLSISGSWWS